MSLKTKNKRQHKLRLYLSRHPSLQSELLVLKSLVRLLKTARLANGEKMHWMTPFFPCFSLENTKMNIYSRMKRSRNLVEVTSQLLRSQPASCQYLRRNPLWNSGTPAFWIYIFVIQCPKAGVSFVADIRTLSLSRNEVVIFGYSSLPALHASKSS